MAYLSTVASSSLDFQNFFSAKLTSSLTASDTDIPMDTIPSISEGVLVIDWDVAASREVIFFNSKTATKVVCPSAANGRGFDGSTATTHASGANVIMAPVGDYFRYIRYIATTSTAAWKPLGYVPDSITDNGNRSYTLVFNSVDLTSFISNGMRVKGTPTTAQPTQCTSLNGTTQYYSKTAPAGMAWTDDFVAGAWIKLAAHSTSNDQSIISRWNGTSGWRLSVDVTSGSITLWGYNAGAANYSIIRSVQAVPTARWVHVAAQLDMSAFTATPTTSYVMLDGIDVSAAVARSGTNPTALVQAGDVNVGADNTGLRPFNGKIAQAFVSSAKITQANVRVIKNQGLTAALCTTHNIASAYSFNNAITDINTGNANNLSAQGSAVATNADSPFGLNDGGTPGTSEWGVVMSRVFSTNTTIVIQAPEGSAWPTSPTSAAISAMSYSTEKAPYGMPVSKAKYTIEVFLMGALSVSFGGTGTWHGGSPVITVPIGAWSRFGYEGGVQFSSSVGGARDGQVTLENSPVNANYLNKLCSKMYVSSTLTAIIHTLNKYTDLDISAQTTYAMYVAIVSSTGTETAILASGSPLIIFAECAYV